MPLDSRGLITTFKKQKNFGANSNKIKIFITKKSFHHDKHQRLQLSYHCVSLKLSILKT